MSKHWLVENTKQVIKNIKHFNKEIQSYKSSKNDKALITLVNNIPHYRAWYCFFDKKTKQYLFAPSKYIGYVNMDAVKYHKDNRKTLDGRKTESKLASWYEEVTKASPLYDELCKKLKEFAQLYDKTPNSLFRINIELETIKDNSIENELVRFITKIYKQLSKENQKIVRSQLNKYKI